MADNAQSKPPRTPADKERSRQQSRTVSGKDAARTVGRGGRAQSPRRPTKGGQPAQGDQGRQARSGNARPAQGRQGQGARAQGDRSSSRNQPAVAGRRAGSRPAPRARMQPRRSRATLFTWGIVAIVIVIVVAVVAVKLTSGPAKSTVVTPEPVPASIVSEITHISPSVFNAVGSGGTISSLTVESSQPPLTFTGKSGAFYMGGEYCPYCGATRWAIIAGLSRFGTFKGLETMSSSSTDVYPSTPTFTFTKATYTSPDIKIKLVEEYGQEHTGHAPPVIGHLTKVEKELVSTYDKGTNSTSSGSIPFFDIGNKLIETGAAYNPGLLQGLTRAQIAADLSHATNPVTQAIVGTANRYAAAICSIDGGKPASVCTSAGVQAAGKALGITP